MHRTHRALSSCEFHLSTVASQDDSSDWDDESEADEDFVKNQVVLLLKFVRTLAPSPIAPAPPLPPGAVESTVKEVLFEMTQQLVAHSGAKQQQIAIIRWIQTQIK